MNITQKLALLHEVHSFYTLPNYVECFIERASREFPKPYSIRDTGENRTLRLVGIYDGAFPALRITYDSLEDDLVWWLDNALRIIRENSQQGTDGDSI